MDKALEKSLSPLLEDAARLPQPYPRFHIFGSILVALIVTGAGALFSRWLVDTRYPTMGGWIHGSFMLLIVGGLLYTLLRYENDRRAANIRRFRVVAECNHHIRNAVQVLLFTHDGRIQQESLGMSRQIADAVHRIELTAKPQRKPCQTLTIAKLPIPPTTPQVSRQVEPEGNRQRPPAHYGQLFVRQRARGRGRQSSRGRVCAALA